MTESPGRAGRNLPVAVGVGVGLGALFFLTVFLYKPLFLVVIVAAVCLGMYELVRGLSAKDLHPPLVPLVAGAVAVLCTGYAAGHQAMTTALLLSLPAILVWRVVRGIDGLVGDLATGVLALVYVGFLAAFAALMLAAHDGDRRITCFVGVVVASDVGGYAVGALFGKHPLAPKISPKKSIEGLAGSVALCTFLGWILCTQLLHTDWWQGVLFGLALVTTATLGDLFESMIKRDLGIKDMGTLLPGHGGVFDRLDSMLPSAPTAWAILAAIAPLHSHLSP
jgi:phosphatidate cytidylyltransferase